MISTLVLAAAFLAIPDAEGSAPPDPGGAARLLDDGLLTDLVALYRDLHSHPELSRREEKTAARLAARLRDLGYEVTERVGGFGVVGILKSGDGPVLLLRTDLDALPVEEKTGLPYASRERAAGSGGEMVPVMHACGHDIHMSCWLGAAAVLSKARSSWRGTAIFLGQPAEEVGEGAGAVLKDGLLARWPRPDHALALHVSADLPAGKLGVTPGFALAAVDSVDVVIRGKGGHGAYPHRTVDPIVIAARTVLSLQTLVSRENDPLEPAVVTVGSIHGGTKHNVIPDEVRLQLTVRSYKEEVRRALLAGIERIVRAEATAARAPDPEVRASEGLPATWNDPDLTRRVSGVLRRTLGEGSVSESRPTMGAEDFGLYGRQKIPALIFWLGSVDPGKHREAQASGSPLPSLHSALFAPDAPAAIRTGVRSLVAASLDLLGSP